MRVVFAGTPDVAIPALEALVRSEHEVVAVLTRPDAPTGRGRKLTPSPVALAAEQAGVRVMKPVTPNALDVVATLQELAPDACAVVAYGALLKRQLLEIPRLGWVNLHFSSLPRWRGAAPVQRAIIAGDTRIGTTCFSLVKELDAGDVISHRDMKMPDATAGEVLAELAETGAPQLVAALESLDRGEPLTPQSSAGITYAEKLSSADARLRFDVPSRDFRNLVMGCSPDPGAWCMWGEKRVKVYRCRVAADAPPLTPGEVRVTSHQVLVGVADGAVELQEVQPPGKRRMNAADWGRGLPGNVVLA